MIRNISSTFPGCCLPNIIKISWCLTQLLLVKYIVSSSIARRVFTEGQLGSAAVESLSADHPFVNADLLQPAETLVFYFIHFYAIGRVA